jgi:hypothetical protein
MGLFISVCVLADEKKSYEEQVKEARGVYEEAVAEVEKKLGSKKDRSDKYKEQYLEAMGNAIIDFQRVLSKALYQEVLKKSRKPEEYNAELVKRLGEEDKELREEFKKLTDDGLGMSLVPHDGKWAEFQESESSIAEAEVVYNLSEFDFEKFRKCFQEKRDRCYGIKVAGAAVKSAYVEKKTDDYWYSFGVDKYVVFWYYFKSVEDQKAKLNLSVGDDDDGLDKTVEKIYLNFDEVKVKKKIKLEFREGYNHLMIVCRNTGRATFELGVRLEPKEPLQILNLHH